MNREIDIEILYDIITDHKLCPTQKEELEKAISILSQQKEPCEYCGVFDTLLLPVARKELCIKVRFCPNCGRRLNQFGTDINVATKTIVD